MKRDSIQAYKYTSDVWYPSFKELITGESLVQVRLSQTGPDLPNIDRDWRVSIWGADDFGMEKDFKKEKIARECFLQILLLPNITLRILNELGFVRA